MVVAGRRSAAWRTRCGTRQVANAVERPPVLGIGDVLEHADLSGTMMIYAHASQEEKRAALGRLDDRLR